MRGKKGEGSERGGLIGRGWEGGRVKGVRGEEGRGEG